jgi:hypothetical protein
MVMATHNDITGDLIATKQPTEEYRNNWDRIFAKKKPADISDQCSVSQSDDQHQHDVKRIVGDW